MNELIKFNSWLQKINNIYYSDNERVLNAYDIILANSEIKKQL